MKMDWGEAWDAIIFTVSCVAIFILGAGPLCAVFLLVIFAGAPVWLFYAAGLPCVLWMALVQIFALNGGWGR